MKVVEWNAQYGSGYGFCLYGIIVQRLWGQRLSDHSMDRLIPDYTDYTHVHMDNATLTAQEGEEEEEGVE
eukprot:53681-Ditylum_brightwellii.AAC.1